jgi:pilus assembly protein CpaB
MRKSSLYMLVAAVVLGLLAVFFARMFVLKGPEGAQVAQVQTVPAVVATAPIAFGEKLTADKLKVVQWPAAGIPQGSFQRVPDAVEDGEKVALRAIDANELITAKAISGEAGRLSASPLLGKSMRAMALPVNEVAGSGGFVVPGDRVDVFLTRMPDDEELPYTDLVVQGVRVLAVGQTADVGSDKPAVVKSATVEVTPLQAQRLALAMSVGTLTLSLRSLSDESKVRLQTAQILDLNDGTVTRVLRKPRAAAVGSAPGAAPAAGGAVAPSGPQVQIVRGTKAESYGVPR